KIFIFWITVSLILFILPGKAVHGGRWANLAQETFDVLDEWKKLRNVAKDLPFVNPPKEVIEALEKEVKRPALEPRELMVILPTDTGIVKRLKKKCSPFGKEIKKVSFIFDVPEVVLYGLIFHESGCDSAIQNPRSTATGLTQMIDGTWIWAKERIRQDFNLELKNRRSPHDSLMAGTWYLNHLFMVAERITGKGKMLSRKDVATWDIPLQYYYAGEGCGPKPKCRPEKEV
ncbi:uncharacterized protein METZ01_LOCUS511136, partial [marine metagenome]